MVVAENAWRESVTATLHEKIEAMAPCAPAGGVGKEERVVFKLRYSKDGVFQASSAVTSLSNCRIVQCVTQVLAKTHVAPLSAGEPDVTFAFVLRPDLPPRPVSKDDPLDWERGATCPAAPKLAPLGSLKAAQIQSTVRSRYSEFRTCYERGLARNPDLQGQVSVRFVIERDGSVQKAAVIFTTLPDCEVVECVRSAYPKIKFPAPDGGMVIVVYPIMLEPG